MAIGPMLIFDKSALQALSPDESVWLENFFLTNITPLFYIETLADLEKQVRSGRTPEEVVGSIARKTPDMSSYPNVHHTTLLAAELRGVADVEITHGRVILGRGRTVKLGNETGVLFEQAPETEAFQRWQQGEFLALERLGAKQWREALSNVDHEEIYQGLKRLYDGQVKPRTLAEVKIFSDRDGRFYRRVPDGEQVYYQSDALKIEQRLYGSVFRGGILAMRRVSFPQK
jgi:hypothetical protein